MTGVAQTDKLKNLYFCWSKQLYTDEKSLFQCFQFASDSKWQQHCSTIGSTFESQASKALIRSGFLSYQVDQAFTWDLTCLMTAFSAWWKSWIVALDWVQIPRSRLFNPFTAQQRPLASGGSSPSTTPHCCRVTQYPDTHSFVSVSLEMF